MTKIKQPLLPPPQVRLEEAAIAILFERIAGLDKERKDDLFAVFMELTECTTPEECAEIQNTMNELMYPDIMGDLVMGRAGDSRPTEGLQGWKEQIGKKIKQLRGEKGLTQEDLAKQAGLPQSHISRIEKGQHSPSSKTLQAIARGLGVELKEIDPSVD